MHIILTSLPEKIMGTPHRIASRQLLKVKLHSLTGVLNLFVQGLKRNNKHREETDKNSDGSH